MSTWHRVRAATCVLSLGIWSLAALFFATVGWRVGRPLVESPGIATPTYAITEWRAALVTAAYSLGGAVVMLGVTALVLPAARRRTMLPLAVLWIATTLGLLASRRVSGWPLVIAAAVALFIAACAMLQLARAAREAWRAERPVVATA